MTTAEQKEFTELEERLQKAEAQNKELRQKIAAVITHTKHTIDELIKLIEG